MSDDFGGVAWDVLNPKTRDTIKEEIFSIYERDDGVISSIEDVQKELGESVPLGVVAIAIGELIEEGKIVEEDVDIDDILAVVRQNRFSISNLEFKLKKLEKKVDIVASGIAKIIKILNRKEERHDGESEGTIETEDSGDGED